MTKLHFFAIFCGAAVTSLFGTAHAAGDAVRGLTLYQERCAACHSIDYNGVGPAHKGLFDRKAGSQTGYAYSPALQTSTVIWTEGTLNKWLTNPEKFIPGQKMGFLVPSAQDRADLIAYLKKATVSN
jgi:cytochrome c